MLTIDQVVQAEPIERVGCPTCSQRKHTDLDCHCCGGIGWVDADDVYSVLHETLFDCCFLEQSAPGWISPGFYTVMEGSYVVLPNRRVDFVTDEQAAMAFRVARAADRPSMFARLLAWVMPKIRGAA